MAVSGQEIVRLFEISNGKEDSFPFVHPVEVEFGYYQSRSEYDHEPNHDTFPEYRMDCAAMRAVPAIYAAAIHRSIQNTCFDGYDGGDGHAVRKGCRS